MLGLMAVFDFAKTEEKILKFWKDRKIFEKSLENRKYARRFVFFEGPPYANGRPGIHHFFGRAVKDLFLRYKTMRGYFVERHAGWDTHGLPIEIEAEKALGIKSKKEIEKLGIGLFNQKAKESIWTYKGDWEKFTNRIGFWLDLDDPYITYEWKYIETLWWIVKEMDKKQLLYQGHKVLPWCPRCGTALASHEVAQGYQDVTETSIYVKFKIKSGQKIGKTSISENTYFLAWTTTPWTLPGNVALAVGSKINYVVAEGKNHEKFILAEKRLGILQEGTVKVVVSQPVKTKDLVGLEYEPLFDVPRLQTKTSHKVYPADFITTEEGTGIVHTAVMYGEDDYELGKKIGLPKHHTVDEGGRFTKEVRDFEGQFVKDAEKGIIEYLKSGGLLFKTETYTHSYPFCWRCKSPLLYYARDSWFVAMSKLRKQLLKNNKKINWVPNHLKNGRFGEFIKDAKDWAFSRERYWGTPLPIWQCTKCDDRLIVGSLDDLEKYRYRPKNIFYIMRHGLSEKDALDGKLSVTAGKLDKDKYDLRPEGIGQAEKAATKLKEAGIDVIYSSPFLRTRQTASIVAKHLGLHAHIDERLRELDHGSICEGKEHSQHINAPCLRPGIKPTMDTKYDDGESWRDVKKRMFSALKELDQKYEGKKILLVSHGDPLWILESLTHNLSDKETVKKRDTRYLMWGETKNINFKNYPYDEAGDIDMHKPYIDEIILKCSKCESEMKRIKEVADVWFDSGSMPYAQWHYPFENKQRFNDNFPADFISEGIDQTRGWFYTLLAISTALGRGAPYKNVISYSHVLDEKGKKMSKSLGNVVDPWDIIEQFGVDAARWYFFTINDPADTKLFAISDVKNKLNGFMMTILNSLRFLELYAKPTNKLPRAQVDSILDQWILSRLFGLVRDVTKMSDLYDITGAGRAIERFVVEDMSNWWIRRSRERFQRPTSRENLEAGLSFFRYVLSEISKLLAPFTPFLADHIYKKVNNRKESVHLEDWPRVKKKFIKSELEETMFELRNFAADGLAQRKANNIKVRQPLRSLEIVRDQKLESELEALLKEELNVKEIIYAKKTLGTKVHENFRVTSHLDTKITQDLLIEGYAREIMRQIQDMRKEAGYKLDELIWAAWEATNPDALEALNRYCEDIAKSTLLKELSRGHNPEQVFDIEKEFELGPQIKVWLGIRSKK